MAETRNGFLSKSFVLIPVLLICSCLLAAALAPVLKVVADAVRGEDVQMHRVVARFATLFAIILFIVFRKNLKSRVKSSIDPTQYPPGKPFLGGLAIGLVALFAVAAVMALLGGASFLNPHVETSAFWEAFGKALLTAVCVAILEEILFRGLVFQNLQADLGTGIAAIVGGAFFSLVHFMRPRKMLDVSGSDPLGGFKVLWHAFDRFGDFKEILPFAVGLFLIAILLTVAYVRTSALFLPMGLHASLVLFSKLDTLFLAPGKKQSTLLFGSADPYPAFLKGVDALSTWIMLVVLAILIGIVGPKLQSQGGKSGS
jgi:membrane protease YdiL (CAAX protease family)